MIPLALVTGFLGSGKTTLLKRLLDRTRGRRIVFLVNEFAPRDVDGALLQVGDVVAIPGGSIFCNCLVTDFVNHLSSIPSRFEGVEGVVIEASGVSDPRVIRRMLEETKLDVVYAIGSIVTIVDPGSFPRLVRALPNVAAQVEAADLVIVNKTDIYEPEMVNATLASVRAVRAEAPVVLTHHCVIDIDPFAPGVPRALHGEYATCADPNFATFAIRPTADLDLDALAQALIAARNDVYRLKGFVFTGGRTYYVDFSCGRLETTSMEGDPGLVLISRGGSLAAGSLAKRIESGRLA